MKFDFPLKFYTMVSPATEIFYGKARVSRNPSVILFPPPPPISAWMESSGMLKLRVFEKGPHVQDALLCCEVFYDKMYRYMLL